MSNLSDFHAEICRHGLQPPEYIEPGKFHRFPGQNKRRGNKAGWCVFFHDGKGGSFGDWSTGLIENWQAQRETPYTAAERTEFKRQVVWQQERLKRLPDQHSAAQPQTRLVR